MEKGLYFMDNGTSIEVQRSNTTIVLELRLNELDFNMNNFKLVNGEWNVQKQYKNKPKIIIVKGVDQLPKIILYV